MIIVEENDFAILSEGGVGRVLNPKSRLPLYSQLETALTRRIGGQEWNVHAPIPPERELIEKYKVSRTTVRQALSNLEQRGIIYRVQGKGTFVASRQVVQALTELTGSVEALLRQGLEPKIELLSRHLETPSIPAQAALQMSEGAATLVVSRRVWLEGAPLYLDTSYFPQELSGVITDEVARGHSMYRAMEENGWILSHGSQSITAIVLADREAQALGVMVGAPALAITRITYSDDQLPIEWSRLIYRADRYEYTVYLRRTQGNDLA